MGGKQIFDDAVCKRVCAALSQGNLVISILPFDLLQGSQKKVGLERLQNDANVSVACYTTDTMSKLLGQGANIFLHVIADNLATFGRDEGSELLRLSSSDPAERYSEAFFAVESSRKWKGRYHLIVVSEKLGLDPEDFNLSVQRGHMINVRGSSVIGVDAVIEWLCSAADAL